MKRKRCPFCLYLYIDLAEHIRDRHFPRHCTVCNMIVEVHETIPVSPPYTAPCPGGMFVV